MELQADVQRQKNTTLKILQQSASEFELAVSTLQTGLQQQRDAIF